MQIGHLEHSRGQARSTLQSRISKFYINLQVIRGVPDKINVYMKCIVILLWHGKFCEKWQVNW